METLRQTQIKYCYRALILSGTTGFILSLSEFRDICRGLLLGTFFSIIDFSLIGTSIPCKISRAKSEILHHIFKLIEFRYVVLSIPLLFAMFHDKYSFGAAIIGLFSVQLILITDHLSNYFVFTKNTRI